MQALIKSRRDRATWPCATGPPTRGGRGAAASRRPAIGSDLHIRPGTTRFPSAADDRRARVPRTIAALGDGVQGGRSRPGTAEPSTASAATQCLQRGLQTLPGSADHGFWADGAFSEWVCVRPLPAPPPDGVGFHVGAMSSRCLLRPLGIELTGVARANRWSYRAARSLIDHAGSQGLRWQVANDRRKSDAPRLECPCPGRRPRPDGRRRPLARVRD